MLALCLVKIKRENILFEQSFASEIRCVAGDEFRHGRTAARTAKSGHANIADDARSASVHSGRSQSMVSMILGGQRALSKKTIARLAVHFKLDPGYFL